MASIIATVRLERDETSRPSALRCPGCGNTVEVVTNAYSLIHNVDPEKYQWVSTRKTSGEADFGRSFRVVAGPETVQARESCVRRCPMRRAGLQATQSSQNQIL